jgi:hypothetical protein
MVRSVVVGRRFEKALDDMSRGDRKGALAAAKARAVIRNIVENGVDPGEAGHVTRYGEQRMDKCVKYDLGAGYRAVCAVAGDRALFLFAGTHDACSRWIQTNQDLDTETVLGTGVVHAVREPAGEAGNMGDTGAEEGRGTLDGHFMPFGEKDLRHVFQGIIQGIRGGGGVTRLAARHI